MRMAKTENYDGNVPLRITATGDAPGYVGGADIEYGGQAFRLSLPAFRRLLDEGASVLRMLEAGESEGGEAA